MNKEKIYSDMLGLLSNVRLAVKKDKNVKKESDALNVFNQLDIVGKQNEKEMQNQMNTLSEHYEIKKKFDILKRKRLIWVDSVFLLPFFTIFCSFVLNTISNNEVLPSSLSQVAEHGFGIFLLLIFGYMFNGLGVLIKTKKLIKEVESKNIYMTSFLWKLLNSSNFTENERKTFDVESYDKTLLKNLFKRFKLDKLDESNFELVSMKKLDKKIILKNLQTKKDGGVKDVLDSFK